LLVARTLQGALAGTVTACITMVSTTTPRRHLGFALGMMQGAFMLGASVGPLIGGPFIRQWGYQASLIGAGVIVVLAGLAVQLWVREDFQPKAGDAGKMHFFIDAKRVLGIKAFAVMLMCLTAVQFGFGIIMPVIPLFLQQLAGEVDADQILATAGLVFALGGLVGALSSAVISKWSDRWGGGRVLVLGLATTGLFYVAQGMATNVMFFAALAILSGLATGVIRPVANVMIAQAVPEEDRGKAFGVMSSATAFGWSMGPVFGGYIGAHWGFRSVFWLTAVLFVVMSLVVQQALRGLNSVHEEGKERQRQALLRRWRDHLGKRRGDKGND
jgi:MFS transporter, DHA1 family, multidrug resistance protein